MIRLFKRRTDKPSLMYPVFQRLGAAIDKRQRQCARFLFLKFEQYSKLQKIYWLVLFCLFFGGGVLYVFLSAIENKSNRFFIDRLSFPQNVIENDTIGAIRRPIINEGQYQRLQRIEKYMDSLQASPTGTVMYDSIVKTRAGLLDSIRFIENIYEQQVKSK